MRAEGSTDEQSLVVERDRNTYLQNVKVWRAALQTERGARIDDDDGWSVIDEARGLEAWAVRGAQTHFGAAYAMTAYMNAKGGHLRGMKFCTRLLRYCHMHWYSGYESRSQHTHTRCAISLLLLHFILNLLQYSVNVRRIAKSDAP